MKKNNGLTLGVDCGGTNLKIALVDKTGKILASELVSMDFTKDSGHAIGMIADNIKAFLKETGAAGVKSIGMGIAGDVDQGTGVVRYSPNLNWKNVPLKAALKRKFSIPICIDNDANCAAWGAYCLDAKKDCADLVCLTLGTGVGGGIIQNHRLHRGATGSAGEIGHMTIDYRGRRCKCGNFGCLESLVGAWGLVKSSEEALAKGKAPILKQVMLAAGTRIPSPKVLAEAAKKGDAFSKSLWKEAGEQLGAGLSNIVNLLNPDRIVLCGGVSKAGDLILKPALASLKKRAFEAPRKAAKVSISRYDERLGVVGAALLFWESEDL